MGRQQGSEISALSLPSPAEIRIHYRSKATLADSLALDSISSKRVPVNGRRVSDLPGGTVGVCFGALTLRERRLTSLEGLRVYQKMSTLFLQDNCLMTLEHLGMQPDLTILRLERNLIDNFLGTERCPKLKEVYLDGNPVAKNELYHIMACLSLNPGLVKVSGNVLSKPEKHLVVLLDRPIMRIALSQGWMLSTTSNPNADVDLPVEEFFFRLDPAVEQLLEQGVPAAYCNINVHYHLRRSYEMLATVHIQPSFPSTQQRTALMISASSNISSSHHTGGVKQPWKYTSIHSHSHTESVGAPPRSKWADLQPNQIESLITQDEEDAIISRAQKDSQHEDSLVTSDTSQMGLSQVTGNQTQDQVGDHIAGHERFETENDEDRSGLGTKGDDALKRENNKFHDIDTSEEVLNWKLSSLDFDRISPKKKSDSNSKLPRSRRDGPGSPKGEQVTTLFPGTGFVPSPDSRRPPRLAASSKSNRDQSRSEGYSPNKMPRSPNSSTGSNNSPSPEKNSSAERSQKSHLRKSSFSQRLVYSSERRAADMFYLDKPVDRSPVRRSRHTTARPSRKGASSKLPADDDRSNTSGKPTDGDGDVHDDSYGGAGGGGKNGDNDILHMLRDIKMVSTAYADVEPWIVTESPSNEKVDAPISELLSSFAKIVNGQEWGVKEIAAKVSAKNPDIQGSRRMRKQSSGTPEGEEDLIDSWRESQLGAMGTKSTATCPSKTLVFSGPHSPDNKCSQDSKRPQVKSKSSKYSTAYPFGFAEPKPKEPTPKKEKNIRAKYLYAPDSEDLRAEGFTAAHPGSIWKLSRTFYGKMILEEAIHLLQNWHAVSSGRQRLRLAVRSQREQDPLKYSFREAIASKVGYVSPDNSRRVHQDVSIVRLKDEAFRVWLLNAAWMICKSGMRARIRYRVLGTCLSKWKLYIGILAERRRHFSSIQSQRIAMMQRSICWHKDVVCRHGGGKKEHSGAVLRNYAFAMESALWLFRRSMGACLKKNGASRKCLDERVQLYISHHRALQTNAFRVWRNFARDIKVALLTERVQEIESRLTNMVQASISSLDSATVEAAGGKEREEETKSQPHMSRSETRWDRESLEALVEAKLIDYEQPFHPNLKSIVLDLLLAVTRE